MNASIQKVMLPVSFDGASEAARKMAFELARRFDAELLLLHVVETPPVQVYEPRRTGADPDLFDRYNETLWHTKNEQLLVDYLEIAKNKLEAICSPSNGIKCRIETTQGHAAEEILKSIESYQPDMVVMATHQRQGLKHVFLGSVTEKVVRYSPVPVLAVPLVA